METISVEKTVGEKSQPAMMKYAGKLRTTKPSKLPQVTRKSIRFWLDSPKLLSKTINVDEHQKLVIKALEEQSKMDYLTKDQIDLLKQEIDIL